MRVLWVCNIMLPVVAEYLQLEASNKEGWLTGLSTTILKYQSENGIELGVCFPALGELAEFERILPASGTDARIHAFGFYEDVHRAEVYEERTEKRLREIIGKFEPDVLHCFGTEFPHTLAAVKAFGRRERTLIGIQGLCSIYAGHFRADLTDRDAALKRSRELSPTCKWEINREILGGIALHREDADGIILLSAFPCGPDAMVNELIARRVKGIPLLNLVLDSQTGTAGVETRLESFIDIIRFKEGNL